MTNVRHYTTKPAVWPIKSKDIPSGPFSPLNSVQGKWPWRSDNASTADGCAPVNLETQILSVHPIYKMLLVVKKLRCVVVVKDCAAHAEGLQLKVAVLPLSHLEGHVVYCVRENARSVACPLFLARFF